MSAQIKDGGAAFPRPFSGNCVAQKGMTLRDYFAAKAMQGLLADPTSDELFVDMADMAKVAYRAADAMLRAREVQP